MRSRAGRCCCASPGIEAADRERGLASIERNTRAQAQIINDLLDMSRIIAGKLHLEIHAIDLRDVINAAIEAVTPAAEARRVTIEPRLDPTVAISRGDPNRLQQVMWNLISNAVKFTPPEGRIEITLERVDDLVEIRVQDTGIGIRPEFLPYVFDRFRQADASTTRRYGGLGLGLSIVRNLVELHGGTVRAESDGENLGSRFIVSLPLSQTAALDRRHRLGDAPRGRAAGPPRGARAPAARRRDHPHRRRRAGHARADAADHRGSRRTHDRPSRRPERWRSWVPASPSTCMVSDIAMPGTDGYALIRQIRDTERERGTRPLPAIAATAYARAEDRQRSCWPATSCTSPSRSSRAS